MFYRLSAKTTVVSCHIIVRSASLFTCLLLKHNSTVELIDFPAGILNLKPYFLSRAMITYSHRVFIKIFHQPVLLLVKKTKPINCQGNCSHSLIFLFCVAIQISVCCSGNISGLLFLKSGPSVWLEVGPLTMTLFLPVKLGYWNEVPSLFPSSWAGH